MVYLGIEVRISCFGKVFTRKIRRTDDDENYELRKAVKFLQPPKFLFKAKYAYLEYGSFFQQK